MNALNFTSLELIKPRSRNKSLHFRSQEIAQLFWAYFLVICLVDDLSETGQEDVNTDLFVD